MYALRMFFLLVSEVRYFLFTDCRSTFRPNPAAAQLGSFCGWCGDPSGRRPPPPPIPLYLLPTAYCLLPTAYCLLPTAYCLLL